MRLVSSVGVIVVWVDPGRAPSDGTCQNPPAGRIPVGANSGAALRQRGCRSWELDEEYHGVWLQSEDGILAHHQGTVPHAWRLL